MKLYIVIPCYNEEEVLPWSLERLTALITRLRDELSVEARLLLVDDGSRDRTWQVISDAADRHPEVAGLKLAHNVGHQNALWAGLEQAVDKCDATVSIDADLRHKRRSLL